MSEDQLIIEVCSRDEAGEILTSPERCADVTLLISIGDAGMEPPPGYDSVANKLRLTFLDEDDERGASEEQVRQIIEAAESLSGGSGRILVHCRAGISRSAAAAVILRAVLLGPGRERDAVTAVLAQRPAAWPNRRMIAFADRLLRRNGRLTANVAHVLYGPDFLGAVWYCSVEV